MDGGPSLGIPDASPFVNYLADKVGVMADIMHGGRLLSQGKYILFMLVLTVYHFQV